MRETPRQFLIKAAAHEMRCQGLRADDAVALIISDGRGCAPGTYGAEARRYVLSITDRAYDRLIATVTREAK